MSSVTNGHCSNYLHSIRRVSKVCQTLLVRPRALLLPRCIPRLLVELVLDPWGRRTNGRGDR